MKIGNQRKLFGFTLVEMLMSASCGTFILAAVIAASVSMQRSFAAMQNYSQIEGDQLRVLDYIAMDTRRATSASIGTVTVSNGSTNITENQLVLTVPAYYSAMDNTATVNAPTLSNGAISYGGGTVTIKYYIKFYNLAGNAAGNVGFFVREVVNGATDNITPIARNVSTFTVNPIMQSNPWSSISCSIMFFPTFKRNTGSGTWWSGSAVDNAVGSNGDWFVIDATASNQATVGDVYSKSGGSYSLIQNVKATTVYCNTFLRNASAR
jgi:hypothetical protein